MKRTDIILSGGTKVSPKRIFILLPCGDCRKERIGAYTTLAKAKDAKRLTCERIVSVPVDEDPA